MYIYIYISLPIYICIYIYISLPIYICIYIYISLPIYIPNLRIIGVMTITIKDIIIVFISIKTFFLFSYTIMIITIKNIMIVFISLLS